MFWSKLWFFVVAIAAAVAVTLALLMPRPAQRARVVEERQRLVVACDVVSILLSENARTRVELAGTFARAPEMIGALEQASGAQAITDAASRAARDAGGRLIGSVEGARPDFAILIDRKGRVLARVGVDESDFGDVLAGRPLVDDALAGYLRDDLWIEKGRLFLVSAAPVVRRDPSVAYTGAVVLGHALTKELTDKLVGSLDVDIGFYVGSDVVASSATVVLDDEALAKALPHQGDVRRDCAANPPFNLRAGKEDYTAVVARLPGEAEQKGAFYTVFIEKPRAIGFAGTLGAVRQNDLSFGSFPWVLVGVGLVLVLGIGMVLMVLEADRPLRRLAADTVKLAKGEAERLAEDDHHGKFGSIARSVNIAIDKLSREAKAARKDLDQLLGPAPEGSLGAADLIGTALPVARPGGSQPAFAPPPPSEFRFGDKGGSGAKPAPRSIPVPAIEDLDLGPARPAPAPAMAAPPIAAAPKTPPPRPPGPPPRPPVPGTGTPPPGGPPRGRAIDDDILSVDESAEISNVGVEPGSADEEAYFRGVFDDFLALKAKCGEASGGVTFPKFADKLRKNRDELVARTGCRQVKFTVYVKDGKAALKATPVKQSA